MSDLVRRLRAYGPESDYEGVMSEAADRIEAHEGSGLPAFVSLVGVPDGAVEVTAGAREALLSAGWVAPELVDAVEDRSWMEGFNAATREDAA